MPSNEELKHQARAKARSILSQSQSFRGMERDEQLRVYQNLVNEQYQDLARQNGSEQGELATGFAAADLLREQRNERIDQAGGLLGDAVQDVDFPGFVRDLLTGVFDANLDANERQMEAYRELLKDATREISAFVNEIDDESAMYRLVQDNNQFQLSFGDSSFLDSGFSDSDSSDSSNQAELPTITDPNGQQVDPNVIKAKILDTKLAMARERRTLLRETLLMGISRLVVDRGTIKAGVEFRVRAAEKTQTKQQGQENVQQAKRSGFIRRKIRRTSQISIAASQSQTNTDLSATLKGAVEIQFKSDYFKLDNFTQIFDLGEGQVPQGAATQPQQLPATDGQ
ncbi:MAG: hypothetical protein QNJ53_19485 [Pleurocapsa sp. MO_192.B19]|nr:hypothetical protein [Pleurocapsa sp. MO_192.B19]